MRLNDKPTQPVVDCVDGILVHGYFSLAADAAALLGGFPYHISMPRCTAGAASAALPHRDPPLDTRSRRFPWGGFPGSPPPPREWVSRQVRREWEPGCIQIPAEAAISSGTDLAGSRPAVLQSQTGLPPL